MHDNLKPNKRALEKREPKKKHKHLNLDTRRIVPRQENKTKLITKHDEKEHKSLAEVGRTDERENFLPEGEREKKKKKKGRSAAIVSTQWTR